MTIAFPVVAFPTHDRIRWFERQNRPHASLSLAGSVLKRLPLTSPMFYLAVGAVLGPWTLLTPNANMLRAVFHPQGARRFIVNWTDVARVLLDRAERELAAAHDDAAANLWQEISEYAKDVPKPASRRLQSADVLLPVHIKRDAVELRLFSTIMTIGTPQDITLQELRIETLFPPMRRRNGRGERRCSERTM